MIFVELRKAFALATTFAIAGTLLVTSPIQAKNKKGAREEYIKEIAQSVKKTKAYFSGNTLNYYARGHGTQVEYMAPNGYSYLWYPKNKAIVPGKWKVELMYGRVHICYKYPSNSYNALTLQWGGKWHCDDADRSLDDNLERIKGDPFGLRTELPFKLFKSKTSFKRLAKKGKIDSSKLRYLEVPPR